MAIEKPEDRAVEYVTEFVFDIYQHIEQKFIYSKGVGHPDVIAKLTIAAVNIIGCEAIATAVSEITDAINDHD